jgi:hypothetical protein
MPNNANARREKGKKKDNRKKTDPPPLHKEDKASMDSSSRSLTLTLAEKYAASLDSGSLSLSLVGTDGTADPSDPKYLLEFQRSLTQEEKLDMHSEVMKANPEVTAKELAAIKRAVMLKAALEARKKRIQDAKDSSLSLPSPTGSVSKAAKLTDASSKDVSLSLLHLGAVKTATPLSLMAQPKSDATAKEKPYSLSLTKEEGHPSFRRPS